MNFNKFIIIAFVCFVAGLTLNLILQSNSEPSSEKTISFNPNQQSIVEMPQDPRSPVIIPISSPFLMETSSKVPAMIYYTVIIQANSLSITVTLGTSSTMNVAEQTMYFSKSDVKRFAVICDIIKSYEQSPYCLIEKTVQSGGYSEHVFLYYRDARFQF